MVAHDQVKPTVTETDEPDEAKAVISGAAFNPRLPADFAKSPVAVVTEEVVRRALQPTRPAHHPLTAILAIAGSNRISRPHAANVFSLVLFLARDDSAGSCRRQSVQVERDVPGDEKIKQPVAIVITECASG